MEPDQPLSPEGVAGAPEPVTEAPAPARFARRDAAFLSEGVVCAGWYYVPSDLLPGEPRPAIVMAHGYGAVKEMCLDRFAERFAAAGFVVLLFDFRFTGASGGFPRGRLIYYEQHRDLRNAITWVSLQPEVDRDRIGAWGTSFSGGHVLHLAAFDRRIRAVVAHAPATNTWETYFKKLKPKALAKRAEWLAATRREEYASGVVQYFPLVAPEGQACVMPRRKPTSGLPKQRSAARPTGTTRSLWNRSRSMRSMLQSPISGSSLRLHC